MLYSIKYFKQHAVIFDLMKNSRILNIIYFLVFSIGVVLEFFQFISLNQFMILLFGVLGFFSAFYNTDKLPEESILKNNKHRIVATLIIIVVFLSCMLFIFYPTIERVLTLAVASFSISAGLTLTEWREKAQLYDRLKSYSNNTN
jgi:hypothetical protein